MESDWNPKRKPGKLISAPGTRCGLRKTTQNRRVTLWVDTWFLSVSSSMFFDPRTETGLQGFPFIEGATNRLQLALTSKIVQTRGNSRIGILPRVTS